MYSNRIHILYIIAVITKKVNIFNWQHDDIKLIITYAPTCIILEHRNIIH